MTRKLTLAVSCLAALASFGSPLAFAESPHDGYQSVEPPYQGKNSNPTGDIKQVQRLLSETLGALKNLNLNRAESACNGENKFTAS